jgi:hypothetical protein
VRAFSAQARIVSALPDDPALRTLPSVDSVQKAPQGVAGRGRSVEHFSLPFRCIGRLLDLILFLLWMPDVRFRVHGEKLDVIGISHAVEFVQTVYLDRAIVGTCDSKACSSAKPA